jgi:hypothetical protein
MLSRKQLEDAARCNEFTLSCSKCSNMEAQSMVSCTEESAKTALALADMCKRKEWVKCPGHEDILFCPHCGKMQIYGHTEDCELSALLKGLEVENANKI